MARPRRDREEEEEAAGGDGFELPDPLDGYRPLRLPGPRSTLQPEWIEVLARAVAEGDTLREAAARVGATEGALGQWLQRGKTHADEGREDDYTRLYVEVEYARTSFQRWLRKTGDRLAAGTKASTAWWKWRLIVSDQKNYGTQASTTGGTGAAGFTALTPDDAVRIVEEKLQRFLRDHAERAALARGEPKPDAEGGNATP